jgi:methionine sulfoxide reductase heme-binding subunit
MGNTAVTTPILWYTSRGTGIVTLILFTATVILGILTSTRSGTALWPRFAVSEIHRRLSLLAMSFLALHILTSVTDSFVHIGWPAVLIPFTSGYKPLWVGLGTVALDLMLAVLVTSLLRNRLSASVWRGIHWLAYASWPIAVIHGIGIGTDLRFGWMQAIVAVCLASVGGALAWRVLARPRPGGLRTAAPRQPRPDQVATAPPLPAGRRGATSGGSPRLVARSSRKAVRR